MRNLLRNWLGITCLLVMSNLALAQQAPDPKKTPDGKIWLPIVYDVVVKADDKPVKGAKVTMGGLSGGVLTIIGVVETDDNGHAVFFKPNDPQGQYVEAVIGKKLGIVAEYNGRAQSKEVRHGESLNIEDLPSPPYAPGKISLRGNFEFNFKSGKEAAFFERRNTLPEVVALFNAAVAEFQSGAGSDEIVQETHWDTVGDVCDSSGCHPEATREGLIKRYQIDENIAITSIEYGSASSESDDSEGSSTTPGSSGSSGENNESSIAGSGNVEENYESNYLSSIEEQNSQPNFSFELEMAGNYFEEGDFLLQEQEMEVSGSDPLI